MSPLQALETEFTLKLKSNLPNRIAGYPEEEIAAAIEVIATSFKIKGAALMAELRTQDTV